jgi:hypothetical protein
MNTFAIASIYQQSARISLARCRRWRKVTNVYTSYGSQGKTVDFVLFSDSTVKAATNSQQWYVTISRGRKGLRIITPNKEQLRENILRSGHRTLALDIAKAVGVRQTKRRWFGRLDGALRRFGNEAAMLMRRTRLFTQFHQQRKTTYEQQIPRVLDH